MKNGVIILNGRVPVVGSREARDAAEWDAWYVFGVDDVINELGVV